MYAPKYMLNQMDDILLLGIFDSPLWSKAKDLFKIGLHKATKIPIVKQTLMKLAPAVTNSLISKIPGLDMFAPTLTEMVKNKVANMLGGEDEEEKKESELGGTYKPITYSDESESE